MFKNARGAIFRRFPGLANDGVLRVGLIVLAPYSDEPQTSLDDHVALTSHRLKNVKNSHGAKRN